MKHWRHPFESGHPFREVGLADYAGGGPFARRALGGPNRPTDVIHFLFDIFNVSCDSPVSKTSFTRQHSRLDYWKGTSMTPRQELVLAALAAGDTNSELSPVQAQKLFFLIDKNVADLLGAQQYNFQPYDYGPFDSAVYSDLDWLSVPQEGCIEVVRNGRYRTYRLTQRGREIGLSRLNQLAPQARDYFGRAKDWVKSLSFQELVRAIYQAYPETRVNSIFQG
jgi:hypothetical protein